MQVQHRLSNIIRPGLLLILWIVVGRESFGQQYFLYVDKDAHFSMPIPESWKRTENVSDKVLLVAIGPRDTTLQSGEGIRCSVVRYTASVKENGKNFWKNYKSGLRKKYNRYAGRGDGQLEGVQLDCSYTMFTFLDKSNSIKAIHYYFENEKGAFILSASSAEKNFALNRDTFDYIALNFSFEVNYQRLLDQE